MFNAIHFIGTYTHTKSVQNVEKTHDNFNLALLFACVDMIRFTEHGFNAQHRVTLKTVCVQIHES